VPSAANPIAPPTCWPGADAGEQPADDPRRHHHRPGERQEGHAGPERAVAEDGLHEDRQEEEDAEHRGAEQQHDQVGARPVAVGKDAQRQQRVAAPPSLRGGNDDQGRAEVTARAAAGLATQ
jgi:hypothetical protein